MALKLDGKKCSEIIQKELKEKLTTIKWAEPTLAVVLVGNNPASRSYISLKKKICEAVGIRFTLVEMREDSTISDIGYRLKTLNENPNINAILVQMPLPDRSMEKRVMNMIDPSKDADCMTSTNIGLLMQQQAYTKPCTPAGIIKLLNMNDIQIAHKNVAIFGRSNVVGRPMAELFLQENATVSILHSDSDAQGVNAALSVADIIVSTIGKPRYIEKNLFTDNNIGVKILPHRILIDVGVSKVDGKIIGDFDESCYEIATYYTPYTGGVGPMTVIQLMENVLTCTRNNMK